MIKITKFVVVLVLIVSLVCIHSQCFAQNALRKLGRGTSNVVTSAFEIPKSIQEMFYEEGVMAAATYGVLDGIYKFVLRTVVGVYEVATFPIPFPDGYAPIVEPEFLFSPDDDFVVGGYGY